MKITFANNKQLEVTEVSTIEKVTIQLDSFAKMDDVKDNFTEENLKRVTLNNVEYERIKPVSVSAEMMDGKIFATFSNRYETFEEKTKAIIRDLQETVASLVEGGSM